MITLSFQRSSVTWQIASSRYSVSCRERNNSRIVRWMHRYLCIYFGHTYLWIYVSMYLCILVSMYLCINLFIHLCILVQMHVCMRVYIMYVCNTIYLRMCVYMFACIWAHSFPRALFQENFTSENRFTPKRSGFQLIECSPNLPSVYIGLCKHGNHFTFLL